MQAQIKHKHERHLYKTRSRGFISNLNLATIRHAASSHLVSADTGLYTARASRAAKGVALPIAF